GSHGVRIRALRTEYLEQHVVREPAPVAAVARELTAIVLGKRACIRLDRLDADAIAHRRLAPAHARHQLIDERELVKRRPSGVAAAPVRFRLEPHRESLGEILCRMRLRVPLAKVVYVAAA